MGKESFCNAGDGGDTGLIPGLGRSLGGGHGNLLQYSCLKNLWKEKPGGHIPWNYKESDETESAEHTWHIHSHKMSKFWDLLHNFVLIAYCQFSSGYLALGE